MFRTTFRLMALLGCLWPAIAAGADGWSRLRSGMTPVETAATLGAPLIRSGGHGFELWVYDGHAEVVFYRGPVVAWTAPLGRDPAESRFSSFHFGDPVV